MEVISFSSLEPLAIFHGLLWVTGIKKPFPLYAALMGGRMMRICS